MIEVLVPDDAPLSARFVLEFEVIGAVDEDGLPQEMKAQALVIIDQQRMIESTCQPDGRRSSSARDFRSCSDLFPCRP